LHRIHLHCARGEQDVLCADSLVHDIVGRQIEQGVIGSDINRRDTLALRKNRMVGIECFDYERARRKKAFRHALKASQLFVLISKREKSAERDVDKTETAATNLHIGEVAHCDRDVRTARFGTHFRDHRGRRIDPRHAHAARGQ
jgi:hypothetical protein